MHHLCWAIKEGIISKRKQIPCGRLLSEIFTQGKVLEILRRNDLVSDSFLGTRTGKIINGKTLQNMKIIKKFSPNEKDLKESIDQIELMKDFPPTGSLKTKQLLKSSESDFLFKGKIYSETKCMFKFFVIKLNLSTVRGLVKISAH